MAKFIVYIYMDNFTNDNHKKLIEKLQNLFIESTVSDPKTGQLLKLPTFQYYYNGTIDKIEDLHELMRLVVTEITDNYQLAVYKIEDFLFTGLLLHSDNS